MQPNSRWTVSVFLIAAFALLAYAGRQASSPGTTTSVLVTNTSSQSVPVSLYHTVNVPVVQGGTWNVEATGDRNRFFAHDELLAQVGQFSLTDSFTVPSGKHLIIDNISVQSDGSDVDHCFTIGMVTAANGPTKHGIAYFGLRLEGYPANTYANLQTSLDAPANDTVTIYLQRNLHDTQTVADWAISGHYVP